jgi:hypothetical protein
VLDLYLQQSFEKQSGREQAAEVDRLLHQLPIEELKKVASFGLPEMGGASWVDKFKGTPLFESAIALEQEELQAEMQNIQSNYEMSSQHMLKQAIQLRKKLLDLELSRSGGMEMGAPAPMPVPEVPVEAAAPPAPTGDKTASRASAAELKQITEVAARTGVSPRDVVLAKLPRSGLHTAARVGAGAAGATGAVLLAKHLLKKKKGSSKTAADRFDPRVQQEAADATRMRHLVTPFPGTLGGSWGAADSVQVSPQDTQLHAAGRGALHGGLRGAGTGGATGALLGAGLGGAAMYATNRAGTGGYGAGKALRLAASLGALGAGYGGIGGALAGAETGAAKLRAARRYQELADMPPKEQEEKQAAAVPSFGKMLSGYANKNPITTAMTVGGAAVGALKGSGQYDANGREVPRGLGSRLMGGATGAAGGLAVGTAGSIAGRAHDMSKMTRHAGKSPLELLRRGAGDQLKQTATQFGYGKHQGVNNAVGWLKAPPTAAPAVTPPAV